MELDSFIKCQKEWLKALKKSSSFRKKALKVRKNKEEITKLLGSVEVKDAHLQGMQAQLIDPNCTKFTKEESKQTCRASLKNTEANFLKVEDKNEIDYLMKGLTDILQAQKSFMGLLKEELKEKTERVEMYKDHFDHFFMP